MMEQRAAPQKLMGYYTLPSSELLQVAAFDIPKAELLTANSFQGIH